jgi:hypothetical protein
MLYSCSEPDTSTFDDAGLQFVDQKWKLVRMSGNMVNSVTTGAEMDWQEYYIFSVNGTFKKYRTRAGVVSEAAGTFEVAEYENDEADYLELRYTEGLELIGNCFGNQKELLMYRSATEISNTWQACDGPGLDYVLTED